MGGGGGGGLKKILVGLEGIKAKGNVDLEIKGIEKTKKLPHMENQKKLKKEIIK